MADMKITELQLASAVAADFSIPADNGSQTYRITVAQLEAYLLPVTSQNSAYAISERNKLILGPVTADRVFTLPTAAGKLGQTHKIVNCSTGGYKITVATTSSQTIGGRASSDIALYRQGDFVEVVSDNTNWEILTKKETQWLTQASNLKAVPHTNAAFCAMTNGQLNLTPGLWQVEAQAHLYTAGNNGMYFSISTGLYAATGVDTITAPTSFGATVMLKASGGADNGSMFGNTVLGGILSSTAIDQGPYSSTMFGLFNITANTSVYCVPCMTTNGSATGATVQTMMLGKRLF